jgi:2'-5' RNA ligase superfamily
VTGAGSRTGRPRRFRATARAVVGRVATRIRPGTDLIVPVLDAEPLVGAWLGSPEVDFGGVPLHVTVMYPFLPARSIRQPEEQWLAELAAGIAPFDFALAHLDTFPGVYYLAPQPAAPFVAITEAVQRRWPSCQPYGGVYDSVIPHMTVHLGDDPPAHLADLERVLPIVTRASELWLLGQTPRGWHTWRRFPLGSPLSDPP